MNYKQEYSRPISLKALEYKLSNEPHKLWASEIHDNFIALWLEPDYEKYEPYFMGQKQMGDVLDEDPVLVFVVIYMSIKGFRLLSQLQTGAALWRGFCQFQKLLYRISYARHNGIIIRDFRIFDFDRYPELLSRTQADLSVS